MKTLHIAALEALLVLTPALRHQVVKPPSAADIVAEPLYDAEALKEAEEAEQEAEATAESAEKAYEVPAPVAIAAEEASSSSSNLQAAIHELLHEELSELLRDEETMSLDHFQPSCEAHLRKVNKLLGDAYGDVQVKNILVHECSLDKQFPHAVDAGFNKHEDCLKFAKSFPEAVKKELAGKHGFKEFCNDFYNQAMSKAKSTSDDDDDDDDDDESTSDEDKNGDKKAKEGKTPSEKATDKDVKKPSKEPKDGKKPSKASKDGKKPAKESKDGKKPSKESKDGKEPKDGKKPSQEPKEEKSKVTDSKVPEKPDGTSASPASSESKAEEKTPVYAAPEVDLGHGCKDCRKPSLLDSLWDWLMGNSPASATKPEPMKEPAQEKAKDSAKDEKEEKDAKKEENKKETKEDTKEEASDSDWERLKDMLNNSKSVGGKSAEQKSYASVCVDHLKKVARVIDHSYSDEQAETALETQCNLDKEFHAIRQESFQRHKDCKLFAKLFSKARHEDLDGDESRYNLLCNWYYAYSEQVFDD